MPANHHVPASHDSPPSDSDRGNPDYDIILTALMESARGRAFLEEHARRSRVTETATLLNAIGRIEELLVSRSLEPAGQFEPAPSEPEALSSRAYNADILDADVFEAEPPQNENTAPLTAEREFDVPLETRDIEIMAADGTPDQASAIGCLGPESLSTPTGSHSKIAEPQTCDPFADIRALSDEEKIALFA